MFKHNSSKAVITVDSSTNSLSDSSKKIVIKSHSKKNSNLSYDVRSSIKNARLAQAQKNPSGKYHSKRNLKEKALMFQNGQMSEREFISEVSGLILRVPFQMKCRSIDWKYDFYLYIISRISQIIKCYKPNDNFEFETWFISFLKKRYISFIRLKKRKWIDVRDAELTDFFNDSYEKHNAIKLKSFTYEMLDYSCLTDFETELVKARYGILDDDESTNREAAMIEQNHENQKTHIANVIAKNYAKLLDIRSKIKSAKTDADLELLKAEETKIIRRKRELEAEYNGVKSGVSLRKLSEWYNISRYSIEQTLKEAEIKLYQNNYSVYRIYEM